MNCNSNCFGGNCWWIIILLLLFCCCGNNGGCANAANNNCGCGGCGCCRINPAGEKACLLPRYFFVSVLAFCRFL